MRSVNHRDWAERDHIKQAWVLERRDAATGGAMTSHVSADRKEPAEEDLG